jgi:type II secretory pathway pseudopilin PulG
LPRARIQDVRAGATVVELLVALLIVAVIISVALPVLAASRRAAKQTESLSIMRQAVTVLRAYGNDHKDLFPAFANLGSGFGGPMQIRGQIISTSVFRAHMRLWPAAVFAQDPQGAVFLRHPMLPGRTGSIPGFPDTEDSLFVLTAAVAGAPGLFRLGPTAPNDASLLGPQRWSDVAFPAAKGLVLDAYWWGRPRFVLLAGFVDGSAGAPSPSPEAEASTYPGGGLTGPVLSTIDGLRGRDR